MAAGAAREGETAAGTPPGCAAHTARASRARRRPRDSPHVTARDT